MILFLDCTITTLLMCELLYSQVMESFIHDTLLMCELLYSQGMESFIHDIQMFWGKQLSMKLKFEEKHISKVSCINDSIT
jgi:hypothetical protein